MSKCGQSNPLEQIKSLYTELANEPDKDFGWEKGKINAPALGYEASWLETIPATVWESCAAVGDRKSTRLNSSHTDISRMPSSA